MIKPVEHLIARSYGDQDAVDHQDLVDAIADGAVEAKVGV
jgi:hypothetical protein